MDYKNEISKILIQNPNDYWILFSSIVEKEYLIHKFDFLQFSLGYLPYSIMEDVMLYSYKIILDFKYKDWIFLFENINYNLYYGQMTLYNFLNIFTSFPVQNLIFDENINLYKVNISNPFLKRKTLGLNLTENDLKIILSIGKDWK